MKKNSLSGTLWEALWRAEKPHFPPRKLTKVQEAGLRFERKMGKLLGQEYPDIPLMLGPWIDYKDDGGWFVAQPDILLIPPDGPIRLVECKLKYKPEAEAKIRNLYIPLIRKITGRPVAPFQVCKYLGLYVDAVHDLSSLMKVSENDPDKYRVVHSL